MGILYTIKYRFDDGIRNNIYCFLGIHPVAKLIENYEIDKYSDVIHKQYQEYLDTYCAFMFGSN